MLRRFDLRSLLTNITLSITSAIGFLVAAEFVVRVTLPPPSQISVKTKKAEVDPNIPKGQPLSLGAGNVWDLRDSLYLYTPTGRRLRPNTSAVIEKDAICSCRAEIETNSLGYRNREIGPKTLPRVLFLGDSITFAEYIAEPDCWVRQIETLSKNQTPIETINAGVTASGLADELAILVETGLSTNPDVVVLALYINDAQTTPGIWIRDVPPYLKWSRLAQYIAQRIQRLQPPEREISTITEEMMKSWAKETAKQFPPPATDVRSDEKEDLAWKIQTFFADWGSGFSDGAWGHMTPYFEELKRLSEVNKFKLAIVMFPVADQVYYKEVFDFPQQKAKAIADRLEIPFFDLLPELRKEKAASPEALYYDWCHPTPYGNRKIAQWLLPFINSLVNK